MAFAGTFISQIEKVIQRKYNLTTAHRKQTSPLDDEIRSTSSSADSRPAVYNSNEYTEANFPAVLDSNLTSLTTAQRNIFLVILAILFVLSMCGNMCTLFVNFRRKLRPFFRVCLISLALSDLMNTVFLATSYFSQFTADFVQVWSLGDVMCSLVPFATTCAILASSMTLVGIALDRYFAVMKVVNGFWNPSLISCIACMLCIWLASISIACPVYTFYDLKPVYILTEEYETAAATGWPTRITTTPVAVTINASTTSSLTTRNGFMIMTPKTPNIKEKANLTISTRTIMKSSLAAATGSKSPWKIEVSVNNFSHTLMYKQKLVNMCASDEKNVTAYYAVIFAIIFVPCIVAFFWFNTVIARKLWKRRHLAAIIRQRKIQQKTNCKTVNIETPYTVESAKTEQHKCVSLETKNCTCKSIHTSNNSVPNSLANNLCGQDKTSAAKSESSSTTLNSTVNNTRDARHLRMFNIILLMMAVFVFLRLPAWIFLLMRMYGHYSQPCYWILYFVFGLMNLSSSVLNPLFYTFLTETIQYALRFKAKVSSLLCGCYFTQCCCFYRGKYGNSNESTASVASSNNNGECRSVLNVENTEESCFKATNCYNILCGCHDFLCCHQTHLKPEHKYNLQMHSLQYESKIRSNDSISAANNDKDEGVDCNDEMAEENVGSFSEYNQRIYTIFPPSLVSSSINSESL